MADILNIVPTFYAAGSYEAANPFDATVIKGKYYTVEGIRSVSEMQGDNRDMYGLIFKPAGVAEADYPDMLAEVTSKKGAILTLIAIDGSRVYVPTTYLTAFPLVDGVSLERLCGIIDFGAVPPTLKTEIDSVLIHIKNYVEAHVGVTANVTLGTMPTIGYVSKEQNDVNETTRKNKIADAKSDVILNAEYEETIAKQAAYIIELEAKITALNP